MDYRARARARAGAGAGAGAGADILTSWSRSRDKMERLHNTGDPDPHNNNRCGIQNTENNNQVKLEQRVLCVVIPTGFLPTGSMMSAISWRRSWQL